MSDMVKPVVGRETGSDVQLLTSWNYRPTFAPPSRLLLPYNHLIPLFDALLAEEGVAAVTRPTERLMRLCRVA